MANSSTSENPLPIRGPRGPRGFRAGGVRAGLKPSGSLDLAAIVSDRPAVAAAVTTRSRFFGPPVQVTRERLAADPHARGVIVNAGISNVATGRSGLENARAMARTAAEAAGASVDSFLVASTGVIGVPLPMDKIKAAMPELMSSIDVEGWDLFSRAIMTTDLVPKVARRTFKIRQGLHGVEITVLGICKGSGMIQPNMATMLAFIVTDYPLGPAQARKLIRSTADRTFNCVTVDGDTSTSDMAILLANGAALPRSAVNAARDKKFAQALEEVCEELARKLARDGEGATKLITVEVEEAPDDAAARQVALTIANSPLVKTAIFGNDPNWGRIAAAAGRAGVAFHQCKVQIRLQGKTLLRRGEPIAFDRAALSQSLRAEEVSLRVNLGAGKGSARVWTCDLTYDYIRINAEYTT